jgi:hypothetical protein
VAKHYRTTTKHLSNDNHLTFMKNILIEVLAGKLDNGKSLSATQRKTRHECLSWFAGERKLAKLGAALAKRGR